MYYIEAGDTGEPPNPLAKNYFTLKVLRLKSLAEETQGHCYQCPFF